MDGIFLFSNAKCLGLISEIEEYFYTITVSANTVVAYFNGIRLTRSDVFSWNPFKKASVYLVETTDLEGNEIFLDIPQKYASWKKYKASAGHKVNHSKTPNAGYTECEHPVFGKILCLYTTQVNLFIHLKNT